MSSITHESRLPTVIIKPIIYGNTAEHFGAKRDSDGHTHKWKIYVRPFQPNDSFMYINRIQFRLHETYQNNIRTVTQPPFQVEESGWGEFEIQITIFFADPNEKPVLFYHHLKLFSTEHDVVIGRKLLVNEYYDELVFQEPSDSLFRLLNNTKSNESLTEEDETIQKQYAKKKAETVMLIKNARKRVRNEIQELTERLRVTQENAKRTQQKLIESNLVPSGTFMPITNE